MTDNEIRKGLEKTSCHTTSFTQATFTGRQRQGRQTHAHVTGEGEAAGLPGHTQHGQTDGIAAQHSQTAAAAATELYYYYHYTLGFEALTWPRNIWRGSNNAYSQIQFLLSPQHRHALATASKNGKKLPESREQRPISPPPADAG
ncbi:hypothetical protein E2C01_033218 [Portunus trituberculatus]|uniref:Uncharacterized protein n=1 Tax=Portunus trituberculatus TaxID=210409 RepID=A0A5B7F3L8_PORTR|nr:hypothetical protein [Portunus trituberculatus]